MIVTRFAPSPTGYLHVGNVRTALMNWALARKTGGRFILRLDDTDAERSRPEFADAIRRDLAWLGLHWDAEHRQSGRLALYHDAADRLRAAGRLYDAYETPEELEMRRRVQRARGLPPVYDRAALRLAEAERAALARARAPHRRFLLNPGTVEWDDLIRGPSHIDPESLSDPILIRADGQLLYTLASVVDDTSLGITHVVRGADHVTNTGAQIQIFGALGAAPPVFGHHSLLTGPGGEALSKRLGTLSIGDLRDAGVEALAILSFLARLGTSDPVEVRLSREEVLDGFDIARFGTAPTTFDPVELNRHSARTLRALPDETVVPRLRVLGIPETIAPRFWAAIGPNVETLDEARLWWTLCRDGAVPAIDPADEDFVAEAMALLPPPPWTRDTWADWTAAVKARTGRKGRSLFQPLRKALTGQASGPDMALLMPLLAPPRFPGSAGSPGREE